MLPLRASLPLLAALLIGSARAGTLTAADYEVTTIRGWTVHVEKSLDTYPRKAEALALLDKKLGEVETLVPPAALPTLKEVPIWMSRNVTPGACYHPSAGWLKDNGRVVEMERSIELQNVDNFIDWSPTQPLMMLHELSHAWQHRTQPQGYDNADIKAAYDAAKASGKYEKVRHANGKEQRHYALTNPMEYFAECSEAYFGRNDFQPFDRAELKEFDPTGYAMVEKVWKITPP